MQVIPTTSPQDEATDDLVDRVRHDVVPQAVAGTDVTVAVGGLPAAVDDFANYTFRMLPLVVGFVLLLSFVLLMIVFRSVLVPLKAVIMNLLSVGAAYGVMVAVFQWGWGIDLIGVGKEGPIEAWAPLMLFAVIFGLSMDYEVFLLSRIKEEYDRTGDNAHGRRRRARRHGPGDHRRGRDHGVRVRGLRARPRPLAQAVRARHGHRGAHRRHDRPARARARDDGAARRQELVDPERGSTGILPRIHIEGHPDLDAELAELTDREATGPDRVAQGPARPTCRGPDSRPWSTTGRR